MVPAKRPTDSILGHFRQVHGQLLEHVHYIYLIDLSRLFFDDSHLMSRAVTSTYSGKSSLEAVGVFKVAVRSL